MAYQVLARKYRPQHFSDVIGQDHVTRTLQNAIAQARIAHGYIFSGHRGIGKTTVARILAMALNCRSTDHPVGEPCGSCDSCVEIRNGSSVDVLEIDAATNRGIDEVRELREATRYRPARDRYKIWILDEAHQITDAAFNALLKTLEEPPSHVIFMMATTQPEDIPQTIRSRCQHFSFHAVKFDEIVSQLRGVASQEGIAADEDAVALLAEAGDGSMRDALSIMDQAIACCGERLTAELVRDLVGSVSSEVLEEALGAVQRGSSQEVLGIVDRLLTTGQSATHFARQFVHFLRNALVAKVAGAESQLLQISSDERARVARVAELFSEEDLTRFLQILLRTHAELGYKQEQRFHLELGLLKLVHAARLLPLEQLLSDVTAPGGKSGVAASSGSGGGVPAIAAPRPSAPRGSAPSPAPRPSPFAADLQRRSAPAPEPSVGPAPPVRPKSELSAAAATATALEEQPLKASAPPIREAKSEAKSENAASPVVPSISDTPLSAESLRGRILDELEQANQTTLFTLIASAGCKLDGSEFVMEIARSQAIVDMALGQEGQSGLNLAASKAAGRSLRVKLVGIGSNGAANGSVGEPRQASNLPSGSVRARAADDPVVRRVQEKFNAEIRTVLDHRQKR